jgi:hypothetical protein
LTVSQLQKLIAGVLQRHLEQAQELEIATPSAKTRKVSHLQTSTPVLGQAGRAPWQHPS